jgi:hypothetical protein
MLCQYRFHISPLTGDTRKKCACGKGGGRPPGRRLQGGDTRPELCLGVGMSPDLCLGVGMSPDLCLGVGMPPELCLGVGMPPELCLGVGRPPELCFKSCACGAGTPARAAGRGCLKSCACGVGTPARAAGRGCPQELCLRGRGAQRRHSGGFWARKLSYLTIVAF